MVIWHVLVGLCTDWVTLRSDCVAREFLFFFRNRDLRFLFSSLLLFFFAHSILFRSRVSLPLSLCLFHSVCMRTCISSSAFARVQSRLTNVEQLKIKWSCVPENWSSFIEPNELIGLETGNKREECAPFNHFVLFWILLLLLGAHWPRLWLQFIWKENAFAFINKFCLFSHSFNFGFSNELIIVLLFISCAKRCECVRTCARIAHLNWACLWTQRNGEHRWKPIA